MELLLSSLPASASVSGGDPPLPPLLPPLAHFLPSFCPLRCPLDLPPLLTGVLASGCSALLVAFTAPASSEKLVTVAWLAPVPVGGSGSSRLGGCGVPSECDVQSVRGGSPALLCRGTRCFGACCERSFISFAFTRKLLADKGGNDPNLLSLPMVELSFVSWPK